MVARRMTAAMPRAMARRGSRVAWRGVVRR
jgi:hypothetical protein